MELGAILGMSDEGFDKPLILLLHRLHLHLTSRQLLPHLPQFLLHHTPRLLTRLRLLLKSLRRLYHLLHFHLLPVHVLLDEFVLLAVGEELLGAVEAVL